MFLKDLRCYLSYPIEYNEDTNSLNTFVDKVTCFLKEKEVKILDPRKISCIGVSEIKDRKLLFETKRFEEVSAQMKIIVRKDLRCVDISDFLIVYLPKDIRTTGAIHEMIIADQQKKPVLLLCQQGIEHIPTWLFGIFPLKYMFSNFDNLFSYLDEIDTNCECHKDSRWQFMLRDSTESITNK